MTALQSNAKARKILSPNCSSLIGDHMGNVKANLFTESVASTVKLRIFLPMAHPLSPMLLHQPSKSSMLNLSSMIANSVSNSSVAQASLRPAAQRRLADASTCFKWG